MRAAFFILFLLIIAPVLSAQELRTVTIIQYEVSKNSCQSGDAAIDSITKKAGYACAVFKGRMSINLKGNETVSVLDFLKKEISVSLKGLRGSIADVRVIIPGEMDAVFSPVLGGSFVVGYDSDASKSKGVMLILYIV